MIISRGNGNFVFQHNKTTEGLEQYQDDIEVSQKQRAVAILKCYGGFKEYTRALQDKGYNIPILRNDSPEGRSVDTNKYNRSLHPGDIPLQTIPENSPLGKLKIAISRDKISEKIKFTDDCTLSPGQIEEIKKNQKRVIRFAVKDRLKPTHSSSAKHFSIRTASDVCDIIDDDEIRAKCFADKENPGQRLEKTNDGLMSSYITPLTLFLHQSGENAGKQVAYGQETTIYYTGFGYPVFDDEYCQECKSVSSGRDEKKSELKAIFKQQIFAVLLARQQQIDFEEILEDTKVPLVLNRPFDFMRASTDENAKALEGLVNESLCELFRDQDVADAIKGKIDQVLIWDHPKKVKEEDVKFFGDVANFQTIFQSEQYKDEKGKAIEVFDMTGLDMISVAKSYQDHRKIKLAIPGMVNPVYQDGEGAMLGLSATEESLNVASLGMMQIYLNSIHNLFLEKSKILDASNFDHFKDQQIFSSRDTLLSNDNNPPSCSDTLFTKENLAGVGAGIAVAGTTMLCASALGFGIVSLPVVATAVGVGFVAGGLTYVATKHYVEKAQAEKVGRHTL